MSLMYDKLEEDLFQYVNKIEVQNLKKNKVDQNKIKRRLKQKCNAHDIENKNTILVGTFFSELKNIGVELSHNTMIKVLRKYGKDKG